MRTEQEEKPYGYKLEPGEDLVAAGYAGREGARQLAWAFKGELSSWFSSGFLEEAQEEMQEEAAFPWKEFSWWEKLGVTAMEPAGEGGILKAVWDLCERYKIGAWFCLRDIPIKQSTIDICERCGLNPYRLLSGNCLVLAAENGGHVVRACKEKGIPAAVIGQVKEGIGREIRHGQETGYLGRPVEDELRRAFREGFPSR